MERYSKNIDFSFKPNVSKSNIISISNILSMLDEPFDQVGVAQKTHDKHFDNPDSEYYQMTVEQIIENWKERGKVSMHYGSLNDQYIKHKLEGTDSDVELFLLDYDVDNDERLKGQVDAFNQFIDDLPSNIQLVSREKTVYYKLGDYWIKGRFDALLYDSDANIFIVVDWKTSGNIDTVPNQWTKKLLGPAKCFDALNWFLYTIQVYFYKMALVESKYLPDDIDYRNVAVRIVNFPGKVFEDTGKLYKSYKNAFNFDKNLLDKIFEFGIKKYTILNK